MINAVPPPLQAFRNVRKGGVDQRDDEVSSS
jgi:hypothetical protein